MSVMFILRNIRILEFYAVGYVLGEIGKVIFHNKPCIECDGDKFNEFCAK